MSARQGLPILHELVTRWTFRRRLLAAVGAEPDLFAITDDAGAAGAAGRPGVSSGTRPRRGWPPPGPDGG
jgi:hypothetical protein